jgi:hypothetical protein
MRVAITERDRALFLALGKYGLLTTTQVSGRIFTGIQLSTVLRRLRALEVAKLIYRVRGLDTGEMVWILSRAGEAETKVRHPMIKPNKNGLGHDVLLTELRMSLEAAGLGQNFVPEWAVRRLTYDHRRSQRGDQVVPDGIFSAMNWKKEVITVAVELEVNGKNTKRYEKIFSRYMGQSNLNLVWYFVKTESFGRALHDKWSEVAKFKYRTYSTLVSGGFE